jgi:signal transduction protein with GAF and PtsI domain
MTPNRPVVPAAAREEPAATAPRPAHHDLDLLASVVAVARSAFDAAASSVMWLDQESGELIFAAVAGEGHDSLVGRHFPADRGIAGWVAATGEPMIVDHVQANAAFARDVAVSTGYVPESIMAAQIAHAGACLGVLEVLDMKRQRRGDFGDLELLSLLAGQAAIGLRGAGHGLAAGPPAGRAAVDALISQVGGMDPHAQQAACEVLQALTSFIGSAGE